VAQQVSGIADPELRAALERLGRSVGAGLRHGRPDTAS
jgi:hypothetical protein